MNLANSDRCNEATAQRESPTILMTWDSSYPPGMRSDIVNVTWRVRAAIAAQANDRGFYGSKPLDVLVF